MLLEPFPGVTVFPVAAAGGNHLLVGHGVQSGVSVEILAQRAVKWPEKSSLLVGSGTELVGGDNVVSRFLKVRAGLRDQ